MTTTPPPIAHSERLIAVVGPSGAGKDSVLEAWRTLIARERSQAMPHYAKRVITRAADAGGEAHEAVDPATFHRLREVGSFAIHWQAHGLHYGVRSESIAALQEGRWVVVNTSRAHLPVLREAAPGVRVVEITAPCEVLARRLAERAREDVVAMQQRLQRAGIGVQADLVVHNVGDVGDAARQLHEWWLTLPPQGGGR
ncbi:phosphonate metabolism protein/1,5-bisphosphokinase (PRPP-forming) PhnN [Pseudothauera rhizosphaerae]|uniref:ribose 1,5-bisphosphate phosphokinase n=1 Tax=Pseudothauera rhizosphaerae TaxID=2565932 RepID=A0A4S4AIS6_9RHOO|nr:phosphonate metabolism protein/1,5-bisphosphokinase (PRPP-forming) PhnN [Pseudothauera rhizosphaerae]THF59239.1 phosphonate metabolism protein/1,5-bisphosphokinase (PRPP-forming) PhnN [Pseudothauera rhizosphaerae]